MNRFKNPALRDTYDALIALARNPDSELYVTPGGHRIIDKLGRNRRTGASHRNAFWAGFDGITPAWVEKGTLGYAAFRAGRDFAKEETEGPTMTTTGYTLTKTVIDHTGEKQTTAFRFNHVHKAIEKLRSIKRALIANSGLTCIHDEDTLAILVDGIFISRVDLEITINRDNKEIK